MVTIGGASVGDHDLVRAAAEALGLSLRVASVAVRPGKPTFFGVLGDGRLLLGLPGNPASAFVCAELFLIFKSLWVVPLGFGLHVIGALLCLRDSRFFDLWILRVSRCPRVRNHKIWGCNSYRA